MVMEQQAGNHVRRHVRSWPEPFARRVIASTAFKTEISPRPSYRNEVRSSARRHLQIACGTMIMRSVCPGESASRERAAYWDGVLSRGRRAAPRPHTRNGRDTRRRGYPADQVEDLQERDAFGKYPRRRQETDRSPARGRQQRRKHGDAEDRDQQNPTLSHRPIGQTCGKA